MFEVYLLGIPVVASWVFYRCVLEKDDMPVAVFAMCVYSFAWPITVSLEIAFILVKLVRKLGTWLAPMRHRLVQVLQIAREPELAKASDSSPRRLGRQTHGAFQPGRAR